MADANLVFIDVGESTPVKMERDEAPEHESSPDVSLSSVQSRKKIVNDNEANTSTERVAFTTRERQLLLTLVQQYPVLNDKRIDSKHIVLKKRAWQRITVAYNSNGFVVKRNAAQLKRCWENLKCRKLADSSGQVNDSTGHANDSSVTDEPTSVYVAKANDIMEPRARASKDQFYTLLKFMQRHGDLGKHMPGPQQRQRSDRLWRKLVNILNSLNGGVYKTLDKWKKVWADYKSKTKKKALIMRLGGVRSGFSLTSLERKTLEIMGVSPDDEPTEMEEQGTDRPTTIPTNNEPMIKPDGQPDSDSDLDHDTPVVVASPIRASTPVNGHLSTSQQSTTSRLRARRRESRHSSTSQHSITSRQSTTSRHLTRDLNFDQAMSHFVEVENRRLQLDEMREKNEARRIEVEQERNNILSRFADIAQAMLQNYLQ